VVAAGFPARGTEEEQGGALPPRTSQDAGGGGGGQLGALAPSPCLCAPGPALPLGGGQHPS
jgi:hypothetical protein